MDTDGWMDGWMDGHIAVLSTLLLIKRFKNSPISIWKWNLWNAWRFSVGIKDRCENNKYCNRLFGAAHAAWAIPVANSNWLHKIRRILVVFRFRKALRQLRFWRTTAIDMQPKQNNTLRWDCGHCQAHPWTQQIYRLSTCVKTIWMASLKLSSCSVV